MRKHEAALRILSRLSCTPAAWSGPPPPPLAALASAGAAVATTGGGEGIRSSLQPSLMSSSSCSPELARSAPWRASKL